MKRLLALLLALTMVFALAACGSTQTPAEPPASAPTEANAADTPADDTVYTITIGTITNENFDEVRALYRMKEVFSDSVFVPPMHTVVHTSFVRSKQRFDGYYTALVDIALLRECEFIILTRGSSFGWTIGMQMEPLNAMYIRGGVIRNTTILIH